MNIAKNILSILADLILIIAMISFIGFVEKLTNKLDEPDNGKVVRLIEGKK